MPEKKTSLEIESLLKGTKITLKREILEGEDIEPHVTELLDKLNRLGRIVPIEQTASLTPQAVLSEGLEPSPVLNTRIPEMPVLSNPPHTYTVGQAVIELLNPNNSKWASQPRTVKELQERLTSLAVRGVSNIQTFDSVVRGLLKLGKIRREKIDGAYKYYLVGSESV